MLGVCRRIVSVGASVGLCCRIVALCSPLRPRHPRLRWSIPQRSCSSCALRRCREPPQGHSYLHAPAANRLAGADVLSRVCECGNHETHLHLRWIWLHLFLAGALYLYRGRLPYSAGNLDGVFRGIFREMKYFKEYFVWMFLHHPKIFPRGFG